MWNFYDFDSCANITNNEKVMWNDTNNITL